MSDAKGWQECEAMGHVGPVRDATVAWRDLGLMCDACAGAFGDTRPLQQQIADAVDLIRRLLPGWGSDERGCDLANYAAYEEAVALLAKRGEK